MRVYWDADFWTGRFTLADTDAEPRKVAHVFAHAKFKKIWIIATVTNYKH